LNPKKIERVAKAICFAARHNQMAKCPVCDASTKDGCILAAQFEIEAVAAIREIER